MMRIYDPFNILHAKKQYVGDPPGTIAYTGHYTDIDIKIETFEYDKDSLVFKEMDTIEDAFDKDKVYWINVIGLHDMSLIEKIGKTFGIHHMDLEDIVHVSQWSKIEEKDDSLFSILKMIYLKEEDIIHEHVSIVLKDNVVITMQETAGDVFDEVRNRLHKRLGRITDNGSDYLYYSIIDALVDQYFIIIGKISNRFRHVEVKILEDETGSRDELYTLRKELLYLINAVTPIRESIKQLTENNSQYLDEGMIPYYTDLLEHLNQISDSLNGYKEMTKSLHEMQMANVSNDMNKTMMTLTIFSAIFIPLSFLAGVFGMNFTHIPGLTAPSAFYAFLAVCLVLAGGMLAFFKTKSWF